MPNSKIDRCYKRLGLPNPPTLVTSVSRGAPITFARIRLDCAGRTFDGILADDAYTFHGGYRDQSHLARAFTQTIGTSPRLWRRAKRI
jgi:AraC-like DNA-binding protein